MIEGISMQITITENTADAFENLTLPELLYPLERMGRYRIGEIQTVDGIDTAVGILIFDVIERASGANIELVWLYVAEKNRKTGVGTSLLNTFFNIVNRIPAHQVEFVKCSLPDSAEFADLQNFMEKNYFYFNLEPGRKLEITLDRLHQCPFAQSELPGRPVVSVSEITRGQWNKICQLMDSSGRSFDHNIDAYERKVSAAFLVGGEPDSMILLYKNADSQLELVCLQAGPKNRATKLAELISFSIQTAWSQYGENATVLLECDNPVITALGETYFSEVQLNDEWVGYYRFNRRN